MERALWVFLVWTAWVLGACATDEGAPPPAPDGQLAYELTIEPPENGEIIVDPPEGPYPAGSRVSVTALTGPDYAFDGWTGDLSGRVAERSIFMNRDRTIGAAFRALEEFRVEIADVDDGSIRLSPPGGTYLEGTEVMLAAEADPGFGFTGWTGDLTGIENPKTIVVRGDRSIGAEFDAGVVVELMEPASGTMTTNPPVVSGQFLPYGTTVQVNAFPDPGFELDSIFRMVWLAEPSWPYYVEERTFGFGAAFTLTPDDDRFSLDGEPFDKVVLGAYFTAADTWPELAETGGIVYATPGAKPLSYDVARVPGVSDLPLVVLIHGGGYERNSQKVMRGVARGIAASGRYVVYSVDYRLSTDLDPVPPTPADALEDVFGAILHARGNAPAFGADPDRIALVGDDVGGHLATLAVSVVDRVGDGGYDGTVASEFEPTFLPFGQTLDDVRADLTASIQAVATSYGIFDDPGWDEAVAPLANIPPAAVRTLPPQYFRTGAVDLTSPPSDVRAYSDALAAAGHPTEYAPPVGGATHGYLEWKPDPVSQLGFDATARPAIDEVVAFLDGVFGD